MDIRRLLTFVLIFGAVMLVMPYIFGNKGGAGAGGAAAPTGMANPMFVAATRPAATGPGVEAAAPAMAREGDAQPTTIQLGNPGKESKDKLAIEVSNVTAGIDWVEMNVNDYAQLIDHKDPLRMLEAGKDLVKPFATLGVHVFQAGTEIPPANIPGGATASSVNSKILYDLQYVWKVEKQSPYEVTLLLTYQAQGKAVAEIRKIIAIDPASYNVTITHHVKNLTDQPIKVAIDQMGATELPRDNPQMDDRFFHVAGLDVAKKTVDAARLNLTHLELQKLAGGTRDLGQFSDYAGNPNLWVAASNRFFVAIIRPLPSVATPPVFALDDGRKIPEAMNVASANVDVLHFSEKPQETLGAIRLTGAPVEVAANGTASMPLTVYMGPKKREILEGKFGAAMGTPESDYNIYKYIEIIQFSQGGICGFMTFSWLATWILNAVNWLAHYVTWGNYGVAIMVLVILVRAALHPLTRASQINMAVMSKKMKDIQPKLEAVKKKYAENKSKQTEETMRIYRENNVNPAGGILGCLPMFIQMPIWIALYSGLRMDIDLRHASFVPGWINDLSNPDTIFPLVHRAIGHPIFTVPLLGIDVYGLNVLPILLTAVFFIQMKVQTASQPKPADEQQAQMQKMSQYMIFIFPLFLYGAPSGLNLYYFASTMGGLVDTYFVRKTLKKKGILPANAETLPTHLQKA